MSSNTFQSQPIEHSPPEDRRDFLSVLKSVLPGGRYDREHIDYMPVFACAALLVALVAQVVIPYGQPLTDASPVLTRRPRPVVAPVMPQYAGILQAPVFSPDRKPGEDESGVAGAGPLNGFVVAGVATGRNFAMALVKGPDGSVRTLHIGDTIQDWRLMRIEGSQLTFARDAARHIIPVGAPAGTSAAAASDNKDDDQ
jgi:hypothetical protein